MEDYLDPELAFYNDLDYEDKLRSQQRDSFVSYDDNELVHPEMDYEYEYEYEYQTNEEESLRDLYNHCLQPTLSEAFNYIVPLLIASVVFKSIAQSGKCKKVFSI